MTWSVIRAQHCGWDNRSIMVFNISDGDTSVIIPGLRITLLDSLGNAVTGRLGYGPESKSDTVYILQENHDVDHRPQIYALGPDQQLHPEHGRGDYYVFWLAAPKIDAFASRFQIRIEDVDGPENGGQFKTKTMWLRNGDMLSFCPGYRDVKMSPVYVVLEK